MFSRITSFHKGVHYAMFEFVASLVLHFIVLNC